MNRSVPVLLFASTLTSLFWPQPLQSYPTTAFNVPAAEWIAQQSRRKRYIPPANGQPTKTVGGGSRGCDSEESVTLLALNPTDHIPHTASEYPTFLWFLSDDVTVPVRLTVVEVGNPNTLYEQVFSGMSRGIQSVTLPSNLPALEVGKTYLWTVVVECPDLANNSARLFARVPLQRTEPSEELTAQLAATPNERDRVWLYAEAGYWYDAIALLYQLYTQNPNDLSFKEDFQAFLEVIQPTPHDPSLNAGFQELLDLFQLTPEPDEAVTEPRTDD